MNLNKHLQDKPERHPQILFETSVEWSLLFDCINVGYCNTVSVGSRTFRSLSLFVEKSDGLFRGSRRMCSVRKDALRNFAKLTGKHLCQSIFFNKVIGLWSTTLLTKRLQHRCFPVNFAKFLRTLFNSTSGRLLLPFVIRKTGMVRLRNAVKL